MNGISLRTVMLVAALLGAVLAPAALAQPARSGEDTRPWWDRAPTRSSKHYRIQTDLPVDAARRHGRHLDRMYEAYARQLAALPPREPERMNVYIFARHRDYVMTLKALWDIDAQATGGMFFVRSNGSGLAFWTGALPEQRVRHVIQHEGFHQFAYSRFEADLPLWMNEGLAEFFGASVLIGDELVLGQANPRTLAIVRRAIEREAHVPLATMLAMSDEEWRQRLVEGEADLHYAQAWSMVHFLVYGDDKRYQRPFEEVLHLVNRGTPAAAAFTQVFGDDVEGFETRWRAYAQSAKPSAFLTALERIEFLAEGALELSRQGERGVASLDDLRERLRTIVFTRTVRQHGRAARFTADDDANFEIPHDAIVDRAPAFVVTPAKRRRLGRRQQAFEDRLPMPPSIATRDLAPRSLAVTWKRDPKTGDLSYRIDVRKR